MGHGNQSKRLLVVIAVLGCLSGGCHPAEGPESKLSLQRPRLNEPASGSSVAALAAGETAYKQRIPGNLPTVAYVKYSPGQGTSPSCSLEIFERGRLVANNEKMVECGLMSSPEMLSVEITGTASDLLIFQQKERGTNSYSLRRSSGGIWLISKVEFVYARDNLETGEIDVIRDTADLARTPVPMNGYSPAAIEKNLRESIVQ